jgi:hypothetical protein
MEIEDAESFSPMLPDQHVTAGSWVCLLWRNCFAWIAALFSGADTISMKSGRKLRIKRLLAEGGFSFVYVATDIASNQEYALKKM